MSDDPEVYGNRWLVEEPISKGGQGQVFLVRDISRTPTIDDLFMEFSRLMSIPGAIGSAGYSEKDYKSLFRRFFKTSCLLVEQERTSIGALKKLLPFEEGVASDEAVAVERMKRELSVLESIQHPSLVKVLDSNLDEKWFVMEFIDDGKLSDCLDTYAGRPLDALKAFRPIVEAVSCLHKQGVVHRDIKPDNVFVSSDGKLILGDCGLAFRSEDGDRPTATWENVGTRDFQPPWSHGKRVEEINPTFDVFTLGKVLWSMTSGAPKLLLWYFDREENDVRRRFPDEYGMQYIHKILKKCIAENENDMTVANASDLLRDIDGAISALAKGCQIPSKSRSMNCRFCGLGEYKSDLEYNIFSNARGAYDRSVFICNECGHMEVFAWLHGGRRPPAWE